MLFLVHTWAVSQEDPVRNCRIMGTVRDTHGDGITGASVVLEQLRLETRTDAEGFFCFKGVASGSYHLLVSCEGFQQLHSHPVFVDGSPTQVDLMLTASFRSQIVVTATRTERRLEKVPVRTEVMDRADINKVEARTLADAVEFVTGVRVENNCQNCNFSQVRLLGLDGAYSQVLIDSQPVMSAMSMVYGVDQIPAAMMERIEVVKGGGSALYGPGSIGGVINVIPREPSRNSGDVSTRLEWVDGKPAYSATASLNWVSQDKRTAMTAHGQSDDFSPVDVDGDGFTEAGEKDMQSLGFRLVQYALGGDAKATLDFSETREHRRGGDQLDRPEFMAEVAEAVDATRNTITANWFHSPKGGFDYRLTASYTGNQRDSYYGAGMDPNAYGDTENPLWIGDLQFNHLLKRHTVTWGVQWQTEDMIDRQPAYGRETNETYRNTGLFVQDDWFVNEQLELVLGARMDKHSQVDDAIMSPRVAVSYHPSEMLTWRLSSASGFRGPQIFDEDLHITQAGGEAQVISNHPDLKEESSWNHLLSMEWRPNLAHGAIGLVEVNAFHTQLKDTFLVQETDLPETDFVEFTRLNQGQATVQGVEINLGYAWSSRFKIEGGMVLQSSEFDQPEADFGVVEFFRTPDDYGVMSLFWRAPGDLDVVLASKYTGKMWVPHYEGPGIDEPVLERSPTFLTWDARLAKTFSSRSEPSTQWRIALGARNLTDEYQDDLDQGPQRDAGYVYGPRYPQSFYVTVGASF